MAKTAAERQRERRQRLRQNAVELARYREHDKYRKAIKRAEMTEKELERLRKSGRKATKRWRCKQNVKTKNIVNCVSPYISPASFGKAKAKAERALPKSPRKKMAVLAKLAADANVSVVTRQQSKRALDEETKNSVINFYLNEATSRVMPGKADVMTVRHSDGKKEKMQKRHLVMTVAEAYELFTSEQKDCKIGKSKFASLRPQNVLVTSKMPHNVCGCKYHNNMELLLQCLSKNGGTEMPSKIKDFVKLCVCDTENEDCMSGNCVNCADGSKFKSNVADKAENKATAVSWYQWIQDDEEYLAKRQQIGTLNDVIEEVSVQLQRFIWHDFIKHQQSVAYSRHKELAKTENSNECVLQMDFAENYTISFQDEIQSAHWGQHQVSLYTVMIWHRQTVISYVIVSDCREHEKRSVVTYTAAAMDKITEIKTVSKVYIWTDGPSSQFKNRYIITFVEKLQKIYNVQIMWNYFATSHGKGPNDALGGNVKRIAHRQVLARAIVINDAKTFCSAIEAASSNILVKVVSEADIAKKCTELDCDTMWQNGKPIQGIVNTHCFTITDGSVHAKFYTDSDNVKVYQLYKEPKSNTPLASCKAKKQRESVQPIKRMLFPLMKRRTAAKVTDDTVSSRIQDVESYKRNR